MNLDYKKLQTIKHALQYYVERPNAIDKDVLEEKRLLDVVTCEVETLKEKYGIK